MKNRFLSSLIALSLAFCFAGMQNSPLFAGANEHDTKPNTMVEWIKAHPKATVEYKYPSLKENTRLVADADFTELRNGTPVIIRLTDSVSSDSATTGTNVNFQVVGDVKKNGVVLIRAGEMGTASVTASEPNGMLGQAGKIVISDFSTRAVDGSYVPLRATLSHKGKEKMGVSIIVSWLFCPLFLLMKGGEGEIPAGTEKTVYVAADVEIAV
jgi:hypothetical protein